MAFFCVALYKLASTAILMTWAVCLRSGLTFCKRYCGHRALRPFLKLLLWILAMATHAVTVMTAAIAAMRCILYWRFQVTRQFAIRGDFRISKQTYHNWYDWRSLAMTRTSSQISKQSMGINSNNALHKICGLSLWYLQLSPLPREAAFFLVEVMQQGIFWPSIMPHVN